MNDSSSLRTPRRDSLKHTGRLAAVFTVVLLSAAFRPLGTRADDEHENRLAPEPDDLQSILTPDVARDTAAPPPQPGPARPAIRVHIVKQDAITVRDGAGHGSMFKADAFIARPSETIPAGGAQNFVRVGTADRGKNRPARRARRLSLRVERSEQEQEREARSAHNQPSTQ